MAKDMGIAFFKGIVILAFAAACIPLIPLFILCVVLWKAAKAGDGKGEL